MKTKKVLIQGWANVYENDKYYGSNFVSHVYRSQEEANVNRFVQYKHQAVKCKIVLEIPEEHTVISEDEL